jgi:hypothetical protein
VAGGKREGKKRELRINERNISFQIEVLGYGGACYTTSDHHDPLLHGHNNIFSYTTPVALANGSDKKE